MLGVLFQDLFGGLDSCNMLTIVPDLLVNPMYYTFLVLLVFIVAYHLPKE
jgi:hypothetical protein